jgi:alpha/beta superfamily hydrolase
LQKFISTVEGDNHLRVVEAADHFFEGHLDELYKAVSEYILALSL